ncbi:MAG: histidine kinase [Gemmatimonadaceae bacterium]|nr:histidine kinase [Gemmatimonadaceae bacterium]
MSTSSWTSSLPRETSDLPPLSRRERWVWASGAVGLATFFALLYALRSGLVATHGPERFDWVRQAMYWLAVCWACLPLLPMLAWLVRVAPLGGRRWIRNSLVLCSGTMAAALVRHYLITPIVSLVFAVPDPPDSALARILTYFIVFYVIVGMLHAVHYYRGFRLRQLEAAEMARSLAEARLAALRSQLQPHFMFNVLNSIASLLHSDPFAADRMLTRFAELLRFVLRAGVTDEHTLRDELAVLRQYLDLMQMRFADRLVVTWDIDDAALERLVPWMVMQPLAENALEHGFGQRAESGHLHISARLKGESLLLSLEDDGGGLASTDADARDASGVGIRNTSERLARLYGSLGTLDILDVAGKGVVATVTIAKSRTMTTA